MPHLPALTPACGLPGTETAQRFLSSAYDSVESVFDTLETVRTARQGAAGGARGRLTLQEEDLFRAAIVFTGAGLDATLKQLIRDTLPGLLAMDNEQAHAKFETFAARRLGTAEIADTRRIARYLVSENPRDQLIEDYLYELTGSSLQSLEQVDDTASALGIENPGNFRQRIADLRELFHARNQVSHELDLQRPERPGDRTRRSRSRDDTITLCGGGFETAQLIVNAAGETLNG